MANISFPRKEIEKHVKLTPEIVEKINLFGTAATLNEDELEIEVMPNRPDLISMHGFLRAFKAFLGKETGLKKYRVNNPEKDYKVIIDSSVKSVRPYTTCAIVKGLKFDDEKIKEIIDMQEKLHITVGRNRKKSAIGIYPLEKIKLPITYEARAPSHIKFIPLEMKEEMNGLQILQRHPTGREYANLLKDMDRFPIFIDANKNILSMPPIINSHLTGKITENTSDVFVECSGFDFETQSKVLNIILTTLAEMGGKIFAMDLTYDKKITTPNLSPDKIKISLENVNKLSGLNLKEKDLEKLLAKMGYEYGKGNVFVPAWRVDILHEVDVIEDIIIAYGYDNLVPEIPKVATIGEEQKKGKLERKIAEILIGLGLLEISSFHLVKKDEIELGTKIEVENSKTDYKFLRPNLFIPIMRTFAENKDNEYPQKMFEIGTVFSLSKSVKAETGVQEEKKLAIALSPSNFTELKQVLDYLTKMLGFSYTLKEEKKNGLIEGRSGNIVLDGNEIGYFGEIHPDTLRKWGIKMPITFLEISLEEVFNVI